LLRKLVSSFISPPVGQTDPAIGRDIQHLEL
jgi:hypothetical protein